MAALCRSPAFSSAVAYALSCLGQQDIVLKEKQSEAIKSIYEGKDVFAWLPSGYGKSLHYQLLLFLFHFKLGRTRAIATERSVAVVISPPVSLMVDRVCSLQGHGVCAAILSGIIDNRDYVTVVYIIYGGITGVRQSAAGYREGHRPR